MWLFDKCLTVSVAFQTKRVFVSDSGQLEKQLEDVTLARRDLEDSSKHIKTLEKQMKSITQEKDDLQKVRLVFRVILWIFKELQTSMISLIKLK